MTDTILSRSNGTDLPHRATIAIVIPVFKHSSLVLEAISSVTAAAEHGDAHVIIVDDGCPYFQTLFSCSLSARGHLHYVRQINRGLSGARNRGIEFVLENLPGCEAIFFLDADNRLSRFSISRFQQVLAERPHSDWFYPDINMIGIAWSGDYTGPFRCITQSLMNICEAGSLVRRSVFENGCRFDEKMRAGYEDWEFWISLMERGFMGSHMPVSGFLYRKRAESMLADSGRRHAEIMEYIETKHSWMRDISTLVQLEHHEAPRFAVICSDSVSVLMGSDPETLREITLKEYIDLLHLSLSHPNWASAGAITVFATKWTLQQLQDTAILRSVFWRAEVQLKEANFASIEIRESDGEYYRQEKVSQVRHSDLIFVKASIMRSVIADVNSDWIAKIVEFPDQIGCSSIAVSAPNLHKPAARYRMQSRELFEFFRREKMRGLPELWSGRIKSKHEGTPDLTMTTLKLQDKFGHGVLPCRIKKPGVSSMAMVLPIMEFGGVEKVALRVAREFKRRGFSVDLIIFGNNKAHNYEDFQTAYDQIYFLDHVTEGYGGAVFEGTHLPSNFSETNPEIENLLRSYDVVVNSHAAGIMHGFANLRRAGVVTVDYLHLIEYTKRGLGTGHPVVGLAFEHSIDLMACCSFQMANQLAALGVPRDKIVPVPNGPGAIITQTQIENTAIFRATKGVEPLNVLYFGRLDAQKGLDRLNEIVSSIGGEPEHFKIRIIGDRVVDTESHDDMLVGNEPAIYDDAEIVKAYRWADVIVVPSRFEGLPLTIIEAMMLGVVPIATDVGALSEVVSDGENGYLIKGENVAELMIERLKYLSENRDLLRTLSINACASSAARDWSASTSKLIDRIEAMIIQSDRKKIVRPIFGALKDAHKRSNALMGLSL